MTKHCPICKKPAVKEYMPFCCKRCADVDLGKWLGEGYSIAGRDGEAYVPNNDSYDEY